MDANSRQKRLTRSYLPVRLVMEFILLQSNFGLGIQILFRIHSACRASERWLCFRDMTTGSEPRQQLDLLPITVLELFNERHTRKRNLKQAAALASAAIMWQDGHWVFTTKWGVPIELRSSTTSGTLHSCRLQASD